MLITKLEIYGFGKHENKTIHFQDGIQVLYGQNEAGKTTIQQFMLHMLFGFPQKNSTLLRYEPRSGTKYGGRIYLIDDLYGQIIIERVRGRSAGEVTVYFEDGKTGGEEALDELLRQYDRASFEAIFSFSLLQLQGLEKMDGEELSRTMLASGTTGVDVLLTLEKKMEKEMGELFKKSGKLPAMNVKLAELQEIERELQTARKKADEFTPAIQRIQEIEEQMEHINKNEKEWQAELERYTLARQYAPLRVKKEQLVHQLQRYEELTFPPDGISRFEKLSIQKEEAEARVKQLEKKLVFTEAQLATKQHSESIQALEQLLARESEWHSWRSSLDRLEGEQREGKNTRDSLMSLLGIRKTKENALLQADVSIRSEERMAELLEEKEEHTQQLAFYSRENSVLEDEKRENEQKLDHISINKPREEDYKFLQEWPEIQQKVADAKARVSLEGRQNGQNSKNGIVISACIGIVFLIWGLLTQNWPVAAAGFLAGMAAAVLYKGRSGGTESTGSKTINELKSFIDAYDGYYVKAAQLEKQIQQYEYEAAHLQSKRSALLEKQQSLHEKIRNEQVKLDSVSDRIMEFLQAYGFDEMPRSSIIPELFRMSRQIQALDRAERENEADISQLKKHIHSRLSEAERVMNQRIDPSNLYELLRREYIEQKSAYEKQQDTERKYKESIRLKEDVQQQIILYSEQIKSLFQQTGAKTREQFYETFEHSQQAVRLKNQLSDVEEQLAVHAQHITGEEPVSEPRAEEIEMLKNEAVRQKNALVEERAALLHKTEQLLADEEKEEKEQQFENKKAELAELAREWSVKKAIYEAVRLTMSELKDTKLPAVLETASHCFAEVTEGAYQKLAINENGYFQAISSRDEVYSIIELSQATKEQAYVALRLALAASMQTTAPFPIIMDDPFVHFDSKRLANMIKLIEGLQEKHQFIYFTCHAEMKTKWQKAQIINVSELGNSEEAVIL